MRTTIFSTPVLTPLLRLLAIAILKLSGWKGVGRPIEDARFVLIGAPHTSNWDFVIMLLVVLKLRLNVFWMGKDSLFPFPIGWFMKWLGGIPVDRSRNHNLVDHTVKQYEENPKLIVLIPPEGTRSHVKQWKTGFYHIAVNAKVPILMGYIDMSKKEAGLADFFEPSGDIELDMPKIRAFYATKKGINPENA
ncbi:MAG: lysophospholipid acyltransferase family protein [Pseudohongiellaceae bacterium]|nr:lysophospholipid acyltransferase family protein [Pseudohongiellaceae bacterium]